MKALAIKYRPKTFDDVVEQGSVKQILQEQLRTKTHQNCYLFTGGAGTGKTTCARIFANEINGNKGNPIEIDAASNNGVENVREIIENAKFKALDAPYKVYIIDECFHEDTLINLADGRRLPIKDIEIGMEVNNLIGEGIVKNVFKNLTSLDRLCIIKLTDGSQMLTTKDHLFFTNNGWIEASQLNEEDIIYEGFAVSDMWSKISKQDIQKDLFKRLHEETDIKERASDNAVKSRAEAEEREFGQNESSKPNASTSQHRKDDRDQEKKWDSQSTIQGERRKREIYPRAINSIPVSINGLDFRISDSYKDTEGKWIPNLLQSRPCLTKQNAGDRGGWESPCLEKWFIERFEENGIAPAIRVESIEIYQPGNKNESFESYIGDREKSLGFIELYDLEVSGHSSYFANDILVHNCHMLSTGAWNAMLKLIEEPPAQTIFIFCTTDPQKIPATIISRVQRYDFQRITYQSVVDRLKNILAWENETEEVQGSFNYDDEALGYIAKLADGGMRDAITLLDKCISYNTEISVESVVEALGTINYDVMFELTESIINMNPSEAVKVIEEAHRSGVDLKQFIKQYSYFVLDAYKYYLIGDFEYLQIPSTYADKLDAWDDETYEFIKELLAEIIKLNADIKWEPSPKPLIEATIILLCQEE
ncbi:MAG: AAA family ATPase [Tissierellaceae bacterium]|nr:AAA family ATPase [Tissierellaceae bacterium]